MLLYFGVKLNLFTFFSTLSRLMQWRISCRPPACPPGISMVPR